MNPYEILGVSENADEETIKRAYRELVKKYHPDKYVNNPLADLASEKLKQINEAYDMITSGRASSSGSSNSSGSSQSSQNYSQNSAPSFQTVRMYIQQRRFSAAETMLNQLPRNAEWYYLSGILHLNRGWYDQARSDIMRAIQMDPNNAEYRATFNSMNNVSSGYRSYTSPSYGGSSGGAVCCPGMDACSCCSNLICADCCCECMGGDLIPCC